MSCFTVSDKELLPPVLTAAIFQQVMMSLRMLENYKEREYL